MITSKWSTILTTKYQFAYDRYVVFENAQIKRSSSTWMCGNVIKNETNTKELKNEKFSKDDNILTLHLTSHLILLPSDYYLIDSKFSSLFFNFKFSIIEILVQVHIWIKTAVWYFLIPYIWYFLVLLRW